MGVRYYSPEIGRWITRDSYRGEQTNPQSRNRYIYVENNPVTYFDITGNEKWPKKQTKSVNQWVYDGSPTGDGLWFNFKVIAKVIKYKNGASKFHSNLWVEPPGPAVTIQSWNSAKAWVILDDVWYPMKGKTPKITSDNKGHAIFDKSFSKNDKTKKKTNYKVTTFGDINYIVENEQGSVNAWLDINFKI